MKTLKIHIFCQKWSVLIIIFVLRSYDITELLKNSVRKKYWKKLHKGKFAIFLTPFQASSIKICLQVK